MTAQHLQQMAEIDMGYAVVGVQLERLLDLNQGLIRVAGFGQRAAQIVVGLRTLSVQRKRLFVLVYGLVGLSRRGQGYSELVVGARVLGVLCQSLPPRWNSLGVLMLFRQLRRGIIGFVKVERRRVDAVQAIGANVHELGYVDGAV